MDAGNQSFVINLANLVEKIHEFSLLNPKINSGIYSKTRKTGMTIFIVIAEDVYNG